MLKTMPFPRPLRGGLLIGDADARDAAREAFFAALAAVAPDVVADLAASCGPALRDTDTPHLAFAQTGRLRDVAPVGPAVVAWAARHRLDAPWIVEATIEAL